MTARAEWLSWPPLARLGKRSYALYLWNVPIGVAVGAVLGTSAWAGVFVTLPCR